MPARVLIYSSDGCPFCRAAKTVLRTKGVPFDEVVFSLDDAGRGQLIEHTGAASFPQVLIDGERIGGYRELVALTLEGGLERLGLAQAA